MENVNFIKHAIDFILIIKLLLNFLDAKNVKIRLSEEIYIILLNVIIFYVLIAILKMRKNYLVHFVEKIPRKKILLF